MWNPPVTASPCQPPLGKGAKGTGLRIATTSLRTGLAMTLLLQGVRWAAGHMGPALHYICFVGQGPCALPGMREKTGRADVGIGPYGSATRGAMGGRPQGSPLRMRYKGCGEAGRCGHRPLRSVYR